VTGEDLDRADEQRRSVGPVGQIPQLLEIEVLIQDVAELLLSPCRQVVGADLGQNHVVPQAPEVQHRLIDDLVQGLVRRDRLPELLKFLACQLCVTPHQAIPRQGRTHCPAGGAADCDHVDFFREAAE